MNSERSLYNNKIYSFYRSAKRTNITEFLRSQGKTLKRSGIEYEWKDGSAKVMILGNLWFHQYEQKVATLLTSYVGYITNPIPKLWNFCLAAAVGTIIISLPIVKEAKPFEFPPKNDNMHRVCAYLVMLW